MEDKNSLEIEIGIGTLDVIVSDSDVTKTPRLVFRPSDGTQPLWNTFEDEHGNLVIDLSVGRKPPKVGQEVTLDGRTFEVAGVRCDGHWYYQVLRDTDGVWVPWR